MIEKQFLKSKPECKIIFKLTSEECRNAEQVSVVGNFNNWDISANPMKKLKNGSFTLQLNLPTGQEIQFRYVMDDKFWITDSSADRYVPNGFDEGENAVIQL